MLLLFFAFAGPQGCQTMCQGTLEHYRAAQRFCKTFYTFKQCLAFVRYPLNCKSGVAHNLKFRLFYILFFFNFNLYCPEGLGKPLRGMLGKWVLEEWVGTFPGGGEVAGYIPLMASYLCKQYHQNQHGIGNKNGGIQFNNKDCKIVQHTSY